MSAHGKNEFYCKREKKISTEKRNTICIDHTTSFKSLHVVLVDTFVLVRAENK